MKKWSVSFEKKWIRISNKNSWGFEAKLFNKCLLLGKNSSGEASAFIVFEARDLTKDFSDRLSKRHLEDAEIVSYELFHPPFLVHKVKDLFPKNKFSYLTSCPTPFLEISTEEKKIYVRSKIKIMNVDDSPVLLKFLAHTLSDAPWIEVISQIQDSREAVREILNQKPDLITLDIQMPYMNGVEVLSDLLSKEHYPVLMISSVSLEEGSLVFDALNKGAFDYIQKPRLEERENFKEELLSKITMATEGRNALSALRAMKNSRASSKTLFPMAKYAENLVWCIGSSTGGTQALTEVFRSLPSEIPPTLVVQHIPPVFSKSFADSLNSLCPFTVKEAENGDMLKPNHVYIAPGGQQMKIEKSGSLFKIVINDDEPVNRFKPSVDYLFSCLAKTRELSFVGGILTGMGKDGAQGLLALKNAGALTFAQDEATSAVYGMPRAAFELGAADSVCALYDIAGALLEKSAQVSSRARKVA